MDKVQFHCAMSIASRNACLQLIVNSDPISIHESRKVNLDLELGKFVECLESLRNNYRIVDRNYRIESIIMPRSRHVSYQVQLGTEGSYLQSFQ